ncbi:MAG: WecB/TagA/CpsF family glycosyltransferase [Hyphomicrobiaceae bacterium]|nr:WecB/TagA/CpsF family glycosyltransferase [Hyphomicrobiaceae bacterium]
MEKVSVLVKERRQQVRVNLATMDETVARLADDAQKGKGFTIFTLNLDHLVKLRFDKLFRAVYLRAKYVTADGWPVVWLARRKGAALERTTGADLVEPLCKEAARRGVPVYFFGSSEQSLQDATAYLTKRYPGLEIVGQEAPAYGFSPTGKEADLAIERISQSGAGLCFLALGAPKQELFADRAYLKSGHVGFLCIGAALDFLGGHQQRAPLFMQKTGTEWFYRLVMNPRRLIGRYTKSALVFAEIVARQLLDRSDNKIDFSIWDLKK